MGILVGFGLEWVQREYRGRGGRQMDYFKTGGQPLLHIKAGLVRFHALRGTSLRSA